MKKNIYIFLVLTFFVLTLSGCGKKAEVRNNGSENKSDGEAATEVGNSDSEEDMAATILEMLGKGKSLSCTFSLTDEKEGMSQTGEFYVDGQNKKFRMNADVVSKGENAMAIKSYTVSDGQYAYSWNSMSGKTGFKMKMDKEDNAKASGDNNTADFKEAMKFKCRTWKVDKSVFALPADIKFTDVDEMMKNTAQPSAAGTGIDLCAICSQIPDVSQKATCQKTNCQ